MKFYLFLFRPWYGLVVTFVLAAGMKHALSEWPWRAGWSTWFLLLGFLLIYVDVLPINDIFDREADRINHPERPLASGALSVGQALRAVGLVKTVGYVTFLGTLFPKGWKTLGLNLGLLLIGGLLSLTYSAYPRLKNKGLLGYLPMSLGMIVVTAMGAGATKGRMPMPQLLLGLRFGCLLFATFVVKDFVDWRGDQALGVQTPVVQWGPRRALLWFMLGTFGVYTWAWLSMPMLSWEILIAMLIHGVITVFLMRGRAIRPLVGLNIVAFLLFILGSV